MCEDSDLADYSEGWGDDDGDDDGDGESLVVSCPNCGHDVYEDAEQCPACGDFIVHGGSAWSERPAWWIWLGAAGIVAVILVLAGLIG